jgi:hypothetical protein
MIPEGGDLRDWVAIGFTSSTDRANLVSNFENVGQVWLLLKMNSTGLGPTSWELHTNGLSGASLSGAATLTGNYVPMDLTYDPVAHLVSGTVVNSAENSQQIADWYSFSHIIHGFIFYWLTYLLGRRRWSMGLRLLLAVLVESGWEVTENTSYVVNYYRHQTMSWGLQRRQHPQFHVRHPVRRAGLFHRQQNTGVADDRADHRNGSRRRHRHPRQPHAQHHHVPASVRRDQTLADGEGITCTMRNQVAETGTISADMRLISIKE